MSEQNIKVSVEFADSAAKIALSNFAKQSESIDKSLNKLGTSGKNTFSEIALHVGKASGVFEIFQGNLLANLATKAFDTLVASADALFQTLVVDGVNAAAEQEKAFSQLNIALAQTGIYSEETAKEFDELASSIQSTTGVADDAVITNAALIQSLAQLDKDGLKRATVAAVDLSAALGKDLATTSEALGKAANGNTTAIQKMGIEFQKGATDAQTFENILSSLEQRFGGTAAAQVNTFAGALGLSKTAFGELQEQVGNTIVQNNVVISVIKTVGNVITDLTKSIKGNEQGFKEMVGKGILFAIDGLIAFSEIADTVSRMVTGSIRAVITGYNAMGAAIANVLSAVGLESEETANGFTDAFLESADSLNKTFSEESGLNTIRESLVTIKKSAEDGFTALKNGASTSVAPINNTANSVKGLAEEQKKLDEETQKWAESLAKANREGSGGLEAQIEELRLKKEAELVVNNDYLNKNAETELAFLEAKKQTEESYYSEQEARLQEAYARDVVDVTTYYAAKEQIRNKAITAEKKADIELTKFKQEQEKLRAENLKGTLGYISSLQSESVREFFYIGKAAALATAYIDAQAAVTKALAAAPPPFNFALAAAVGLAAGVNIAKIASASPPAFEDGGIVPGSSFSGDKVAARVNSGEMILNRSQQAELFKVANGSRAGNNGLEARLDALLNLIASKDEAVVVNIGGKTIVDTLRSELRAGRTFA